MFQDAGFLSAPRHAVGIALAAATFVLGLGVGAAVGPFAASRGAAVASQPAAAPSREPSTLRTAHPVEVLRVLDGDTFEARVQLWPGLAITTRVRLRGIDAPELKARCEQERSMAEAARDALQRILAQGDVGIAQVALDKYGGRVVADASTRSTRDIAGALLGSGMVRRYAGGRRESWC
jgi:endonuclease YncB( thermonuclease family)